jgi:hypothetical protein
VEVSQILKKWNNYDSNWKNLLGFRNLQENLENIFFNLIWVKIKYYLFLGFRSDITSITFLSTYQAETP